MTDERDRIDDPKLIFYLERHEQIDEWARLVELERAAANAFLRGLIGDLETRLRDLEAEIVIDNRLLESEEVIALFRPSWLSLNSGDPIPRALIGIGWWKNVRFSTPTNAPLAGLRMGTSRDKELRRAVGAVVSDRNLGKHLFPSGTPAGLGVWVRYRTVSAAGTRFWEDLGPFRSELVNAVYDGWQTFADAIDATITSAALE